MAYTSDSRKAISDLLSEIKKNKRRDTCIAGRRKGSRVKCDEMRPGPVDEPRPHGLLMKSLSGDVEKASTALPRQHKYIRKYVDQKGRVRYVYPKEHAAPAVTQYSEPIVQQPKLRGSRLTERRRSEMELWAKWKETGDKESYAQLVRSFSPLIHRIVGIYKGRVPIPAQALYNEGEIWVGNAITRYDPSKGPLHKFVQGYINKVKSVVAKSQNFGAIPETRVYDVGSFQRAHSELKDTLGREPTVGELSSRLGWDEKKTDRLQRELIPDVAVPGETHYESALTPSDVETTIRMMRADLNEDEKAVYDLMFKESVHSTGDIANRLKISPSKASKLKGSILERIQKEVSRYEY